MLKPKGGKSGKCGSGKGSKGGKEGQKTGKQRAIDTMLESNRRMTDGAYDKLVKFKKAFGG